MGFDLGTMSAAVTLDDADFRKKLGGLEGASSSTFQKIGQLAAGYLSFRALTGFSQGALKEFSRLEEANNKFVNVFRDIPAEAKKVSSSLIDGFDLSNQSALEMLAGTGDLLTGFGFSQKAALDLANAAATLGVDLASYTNYAGGAKGATEALTKGMLGETECLKALGIVIKKDSTEYKTLVSAFQAGGLSDSDFVKVFGSEGSAEYQKAIEQFRDAKNLSQQQAEAMAVLAIAHRQSGNAIGDYNRPGETFAQTQMQIAQSSEKAMASIGAFLSQGVHPAMKGLKDLIGVFNSTDEAGQALIMRTAMLSAGFLALSKTGMFSAANNFFSGISSKGIFNVQAEAEANAVAASEAKKRAEYAKTQAFREAKAAAEAVRAAKLDVQLKSQAVVDAGVNLNRANQTDNQAQIIAAKKQLATASSELTKAQIAESNATQNLTNKHQLAKVANMQHAAATKISTAATKQSAASATLSGKAHIALSGGLNAAKAGFASLNAAIGPVGWAMLALSSGYMAYNYLIEKNNKFYQQNLDAANERVSAVNSEVSANEKARASDQEQLTRLQELSRYERLNSNEKKEAEQIIQRLTSVYGNLGISIDATTGKVRVSTVAWEKLNAAQAQSERKDLAKKANANQALIAATQGDLRNSFGSTLKNGFFNQVTTDFALGMAKGFRAMGIKVKSDEEIDKSRYSSDQNELDSILKLKTAEEQINALTSMRNKLTSASRTAEAQKVKGVIDLLKKQIEYENELKKAAEAKGKGSNAPGKSQESARAHSVSERNAQTSLENSEWNIKFNSGDAEQQIAMLNEKIRKSFELQSGKYASLDAFKGADRSKMTEQELKDLQNIVELEEQRRKIREQSRKEFDAESKNYQQYLIQRAEKQQEKKVERELQKAQQSGDAKTEKAIIQRELAAAQAAASKLQTEYQAAVQKAQADQIMTEEEKQKISELRGQMQKAMAKEDRWKERIDEEGSNKRGKGGGAAGTFGGADVDALDSERQSVNEINRKVETLCRYVEKIQRVESKKTNDTLRFS